jgi:hypothetical protein
VASPLPASFYERVGELAQRPAAGEPWSLVVRATPACRGPWSAAHQHGGPPSALLAWAVHELDPQPGMQTTRATLELSRPVPLDGELLLTARVTRPGKKVRLAEASLSAGGQHLVTLRSQRTRTLPEGALAPEHAAPPVGPRWPAPLEVSASAPYEFSFFTDELAYHRAMELRVTSGRWGSGALAGWMRARIPLFEGAPLRPIERVLLAADSGNGLGVALDLRQVTFLNPDLTVVLAREPEGEWLHLDASTMTFASGVGLTECALSDERGRVGRSSQTLVVEARGSAGA